jgi:uncharacterized C2H2 Zn-finger protein
LVLAFFGRKNFHPSKFYSSYKKEARFLFHIIASFAVIMAPTLSKFQCFECGLEFTKKHDAQNHYSKTHFIQKPQCFQCGAKFSRKGDVKRHYQRVHLNENIVHQCALCGGVFSNSKDFSRHKLLHEPTNSEFTVLSSAFRKKCVIYRKTYAEKMETLDQAFYGDKEKMAEILGYEVTLKKSSKACIIFHAEFIKPLEQTTCVLWLRTATTHLCNLEEIEMFMLEARNNAQRRIEDFTEMGSGWVLDQILSTDIEIGSCPPLNGACNLLSISQLNALQKIKRIRKTKDCFFEAVAFHFRKTDNYYQLHKFIDNHINKTIPSPVKVSDIKRFEKDNSHLDIKINILYSDDEEIYPLLMSKNVGAKHNINLLLFKTAVGKDIISHYAYIDNLNKLLRKKYQRKDGGNAYQNGEACPNCLSHFGSITSLAKHSEGCLVNKPQAVLTPESGEKIKFTKYHKKFRVPLVAFLDFEASQNIPENKCDTCGKKGVTVCPHKTVIKSIQKPITYSLLIVNEKNEIIHKNTFSGENCVEHVMETLLSLENSFMEYVKQNVPMKPLSAKQEIEKRDAVSCHVCEKELGEDRVVDHNHLSGEFIAMAHSDCNLNRRTPRFIPIFVHNFEGYDSHFIMSNLKGDERIYKLEGLPHNTERFKTITINSYVFLDSMAFLSASLNDLVNNLSKNTKHEFNILKQMELYSEKDDYRKSLLIRKGVYPYEFATNIDLLRSTKKLPPIEKFHSILSGTTVSEEDYKHAEEVYKAFNCESMMQYTEIYCATDTALMAEVMLQFREEVYREFNLDCW